MYTSWGDEIYLLSRAVTSVLRRNSPSKCFLLFYGFLPGRVAFIKKSGNINHIALVSHACWYYDALQRYSQSLLYPSYPADSIVCRAVRQTSQTLPLRTIVLITSDNYARVHSFLFAKQHNADNSNAPLFGFFALLNRRLTFSFSDAVPSLFRPLSRSAEGSVGAMTVDRTVAPRWINGPSSRCPFP